jgi:uncharacterized phage protein (TIGR01671 family)
MREIKFRAWDKEMRWMRPVERIDWRTMEFHVRGDVEQNGHAGLTKLIASECTLIQFTGFHDKNGKEIYEGDVIERIVEGKRERFEVVWNGEYGEWQPLMHPTNWTPVFRYVLDSGAEVIGTSTRTRSF